MKSSSNAIKVRTGLKSGGLSGLAMTNHNRTPSRIVRKTKRAK